MVTAQLGDVIPKITENAPGIGINTIMIGGAAIVAIVVICLLFYVWWARSRYNLIVEIKLPRNDGLIVNGEIGKAFYDSKNGVVKIKRKGYRIGEPMEIFDVRRYLQGTNLLTVIQVAPGQYIPVVNKSYTEISIEVDDETRQKKDGDGNLIVDEFGKPVWEKKRIREAIIDVIADPGINKAWKVNWTTHARKAFSVQGFLDRHQTAISIGIVFILCFIGFSILYSKIA